jgi:hypothetical protein
MRYQRVFSRCAGLACAASVSACGAQAAHLVSPPAHVSAVAATPEATAVTSTASASCHSGSGFALSLVSDRGGQPTPVKAAIWFARHGGVPAIPPAGWQQMSRTGSYATVKSGAVTLHVLQGPDRTWQVDSGERCG